MAARARAKGLRVDWGVRRGSKIYSDMVDILQKLADMVAFRDKVYVLIFESYTASKTRREI